MTVTERVFTKRTLDKQLLVKNCHNKLHENQQTNIHLCYVTDRQTDSPKRSARNIIYVDKNLTIMQLRDWEQRVVED